MSTIRITDLVEITHLNVDTNDTVFVGVDIPTDVTGKFTATALAEGLYSHNPLKVGNNEILLENTIAQFAGNNSTYLQVNLQNFDGSGSGDFVVTANTGLSSNSYIDMGINGSEYSDPNYSSMSAYDGYLYINGPSTNSAKGNLIIGTASSGANISFIVGGTTSDNIISYVTKSGLKLNSNKSITFGDNTIQSTAAASNAYSVSSYNAANTALSNISTANTFLQSNDSITLTSAKSYADGKFLANVSNASFSGTLNILDKLNVNGSVIFANTQFTATQAALTIAACPISDIQLPSNDGYMLHISGKQNVSSRIVFDSFGANTYAVIAGRTARGTPTAPQAVLNGDVLMRISGNGYGTTKYSTLGSGRIDIVATEDFTDTSRATQIQFFTTVAGSNTQTQIASFNGSSAVFTGVINPQKGFIYNPNVISGIINSLTIDIANNSLYKFNCNATTTISLSGYESGKVVEVWLKNTDNNNHTVTHGCLANNSTVGTTSFSLTAGHAAYLRYFSIDGDNANTFVSINYS